MSLRSKISFLVCLAMVAAWTSPVYAALSSYPTLATDEAGPTGSPMVAVGPPNYRFVNDAGLGFGGSNTDVFDVGESTVLTFPVALRNIPGQHDLIVYAFVGGLGATDNATVQVETSSDGTNFAVVSTFDTMVARNRFQDLFENDFEAVKHFFVDFGTTDDVTHVRLTNLAGTIEGLRLDGVEGLHPIVDSAHSFELRLERSRFDDWAQFKLRIKNLSDPGAVPIREIRVNNSADPLARLEQTAESVEGIDGDFICVENCIPICGQGCAPGDPPPYVPFARWVWSTDGVNEAPPGLGLEPGRQAAHSPSFGIDTDSVAPYLSGYSFEITFADGLVQFVDYDLDLEKEIGSLYEKHLYFSSTPELSWDRPVDFYEFVGASGPAPGVPGLAGPFAGLLVVLITGVGYRSIRERPHSS